MLALPCTSRRPAGWSVQYTAGLIVLALPCTSRRPAGWSVQYTAGLIVLALPCTSRRPAGWSVQYTAGLLVVVLTLYRQAPGRVVSTVHSGLASRSAGLVPPGAWQGGQYSNPFCLVTGRTRPGNAEIDPLVIHFQGERHITWPLGRAPPPSLARADHVC